jgi:copper chaperone CopZ
MKTKALGLVTLFMFGALLVFASSNKSEKFEVKGNCEMCKEHIEKAAKSVDGVATADWNVETKMLEVTFDESKTSVAGIEKAVAKAGYDTPNQKATDEAYDKIPDCCKYREGDKKEKE